MLRQWDDLPDNMKNCAVYRYYDILSRKKTSLTIKRLFDVVMAALLLVVFFVPIIIISIVIKVDSEGPVFYKQDRVTSYGKVFKIHKFRTMVSDADTLGSQITKEKDSRITKVGSNLRKLRLDEIPQLIDIFCGDMSFVGVRPEVPKFVDCYTDEMLATLLLPAGVTGEACILFNGIEQHILEKATNVEKDYIEIVLPQKMKYNLEQIENFSLFQEFQLLCRTVIAVLK